MTKEIIEDLQIILSSLDYGSDLYKSLDTVVIKLMEESL